MSRFKVAYSPESLQEIKRIINWYNDISLDLGNRFKKSFLAEIAAIKKILLHVPSAMMRYALQ